jgi:hypothetical protein
MHHVPRLRLVFMCYSVRGEVMNAPADPWVEKMTKHPECRHGSHKEFLETLVRTLEKKGIEYKLEQDYLYDEEDWRQAVLITIYFDQFDADYKEQYGEYETHEYEYFLDFLHDIIYELGEEAGFDPSSCPYLEESDDRWTFITPGWWFGEKAMSYKYIGGHRWEGL